MNDTFAVWFRSMGFSFTEEVSKRIITLPLFPGMESDQLKYVAETIKRYNNG